jgi:predicted deacylase
MLEIGTAQAARGEKRRGIVPVPGLPTWANPPVVVIRGSATSPVLSITAGIHGSEYSSIEAAKRLTLEIEPGDLVGVLIICPIVNIAAFQQRSIYINPLDSCNLNRAFPGQSVGSASQRLAAAITGKIIEPADAFVDLHGGDLIEALTPFSLVSAVGPAEAVAQSRRMALEFGLPHIICSQTSGSTYSSAIASGKPALLAEAGEHGVLSREASRALFRGVVRTLAWLGGLTAEGRQRFEWALTPPAETPIIYPSYSWVEAQADGMWYPQIECGAEVQEGQTLGEILSLDDTLRARILAPHQGRVLFLVTSLAINRGDPLLTVASTVSECKSS